MNLSSNSEKWVIGPECPEGAMYIGEDGEPKFTPYGLGYLAAETAKSENMTSRQARAYIDKVARNYLRHSLEKGHSLEDAKLRANAVEDSGKMRLKELYGGAGHQPGRA